MQTEPLKNFQATAGVLWPPLVKAKASWSCHALVPWLHKRHVTMTLPAPSAVNLAASSHTQPFVSCTNAYRWHSFLMNWLLVILQQFPALHTYLTVRLLLTVTNRYSWDRWGTTQAHGCAQSAQYNKGHFSHASYNFIREPIPRLWIMSRPWSFMALVHLGLNPIWSQICTPNQSLPVLGWTTLLPVKLSTSRQRHTDLS